MIIEGLLRVNGEVASIGQKIDPEADRVTVGAKAIPSPKQPELTYLVNKPKGYICSNRDPYNAKTVFDLLPMGLSMRNLFCAGRLDKESEGMAILTNNGSLVQRLTHPSKRVVKRYQVILDRPLSPSTASRLLKGIYDQGEYLKVEKVIPNRRGARIRLQRGASPLPRKKKRDSPSHEGGRLQGKAPLSISNWRPQINRPGQWEMPSPEPEGDRPAHGTSLKSLLPTLRPRCWALGTAERDWALGHLKLA